MRFATVLMVSAIALIAGSASAECTKLDCSHDPNAWAAMMSPNPKYAAEQNKARAEAKAYVAQRDAAKAQAQLPYVPASTLEQITLNTENTMSQARGQTVVVTTMFMFPIKDTDGSNTVAFCGKAVDPSHFTVDHMFAMSKSHGLVWDATVQDFADAGCVGPHYALR